MAALMISVFEAASDEKYYEGFHKFLQVSKTKQKEECCNLISSMWDQTLIV